MYMASLNCVNADRKEKASWKTDCAAAFKRVKCYGCI